MNDEAPRLIVIVGFMGSGKTTIARQLARLLECQSIDLDELISERERRGPREIIEQSGEAEFRRIEGETLRHVLNEQSGDHTTRVIALGGGAWTIKTNRDLIGRLDGVTVWLDAPFETCWQRIEAQVATRPLASSREKAAILYQQRRTLYELARIHVPLLGTETAPEAASTIESALA